MTLETSIVENFENVVSAKFEIENNIKFLRVQTNLKDLKEIENLTRQISDFIDKHNLEDETSFYLDVVSVGTDADINFDDLQNHINEYIQVWLSKEDFVLGYLLDKSKDIITLEINIKGRKKKQILTLQQIEKINSYIKIKKNK
ncbi:ribosome assembly cofactor RimP [Mycoplasma sp. 1654_15]|uniref:ribosome assembly cofactor RimP n=1 Tax=Mycoplasma sp. 1654_15 TaxID=2725994 RepID=UPI0014499A0B|nr:ribosome assembly cofactor RimP [Mycoplasma sp. 1654_15]QJB71114.1 ribosome assembly cofactor RimP [Mycoplasma sp. 1654_15]